MEASDIERIMALSSIFTSGPVSKTSTESQPDTEGHALKIKRQINTLQNILPYIGPDMKKGIYTVIKLMEIADFESENRVITAQGRESFCFDRKKLIEAAQKSLSPQEKQAFNTLCVLSQIKDINLFDGRKK